MCGARYRYLKLNADVIAAEPNRTVAYIVRFAFYGVKKSNSSAPKNMTRCTASNATPSNNFSPGVSHNYSLTLADSLRLFQLLFRECVRFYLVCAIDDVS